MVRADWLLFLEIFSSVSSSTVGRFEVELEVTRSIPASKVRVKLEVEVKLEEVWAEEEDGYSLAGLTRASASVPRDERLQIITGLKETLQYGYRWLEK